MGVIKEAWCLTHSLHYSSAPNLWECTEGCFPLLLSTCGNVLREWVKELYMGTLPTHMSGALEGQKRVSDLLELELQTVVSHHEGTRN